MMRVKNFILILITIIMLISGCAKGMNQNDSTGDGLTVEEDFEIETGETEDIGGF